MNFFLTYGDAVSNVDLNKLLKLHKLNKSFVTVTAVNPDTKYGLLEITNNKKVKNFKKNLNLEINGLVEVFLLLIKKYLNTFQMTNLY